MNGPILAIRADASHSGGTGHIMRTLALAQRWIERGGRCVYLCAILPESMEQRLLSEGCSIHQLEESAGSPEEASETSKLLKQFRPHWLLIDSYPLTPSYQQLLEIPARTKLASISDFGVADFAQPDLIVHPNIAAVADYSSLEYEPTILAGPDYILLRKELFRITAPTISPTANKVLVTMGGSDPKEAAFQLCQHLSFHQFHGTVRVVLGPAYPDDGKMFNYSSSHVELAVSPASMKELYLWADTVICSPSTTALEAAHFGLPIGLIITADNQEKVLQAMLENRAGIQLADARETNIELSNMEPLLTGKTRSSISHNAGNLVDGKGAERICNALGLPNISFSHANKEDAKDLWNWTNDPVTRAASFNSDPISWENHISWFKKQLNSDKVCFLIVSDDIGNKLGTVRFDLDTEAKNEAVISIGLAPHSRGLGLAPLIIDRATIHFFTLNPSYSVTAWIKPENRASHLSFIRANYQDYPSPQYPDRIRMRQQITSP